MTDQQIEVRSGRIKYWVVDPQATSFTIEHSGVDSPQTIRFTTDAVVMTCVLPPDEPFEPPPPIRHGIETKGWRVISKELPHSGLNDMGWVDWRRISEGLSEALRMVLNAEDLDDPEPADQASRALDDFSIAVAEAELRRNITVDETEPERETGGDDDDGVSPEDGE